MDVSQFYLTSDALNAELAEAEDVHRRASARAAHWALQRAYAEIRRFLPTAAVVVVDCTDEPCDVVCVQTVHADGGVKWLWERGQILELDGEDQEFSECLQEVLWYKAPGLLPGWEEKVRKSGVYHVDMNAVPSAIDWRRFPRFPTGLVAFLRDQFATWDPGYVVAAASYCEGILNGQLVPVTTAQEWRAVPHQLGMQSAEATSGGGARPSWEEWESAIKAIHGLAAGIVLWDDGEITGASDEVRHPFYVVRQGCVDHNLTPAAVAGAFGGDLHATAVACLRALSRRSDPDTGPVFQP